MNFQLIKKQIHSQYNYLLWFRIFSPTNHSTSTKTHVKFQLHSTITLLPGYGEHTHTHTIWRTRLIFLVHGQLQKVHFHFPSKRMGPEQGRKCAGQKSDTKVQDHTNIGKSSRKQVFNTLRTGDADLRFLHYNCARRMTQICVFNTRLLSLHNTLNL